MTLLDNDHRAPSKTFFWCDLTILAFLEFFLAGLAGPKNQLRHFTPYKGVRRCAVNLMENGTMVVCSILLQVQKPRRL
jgi:hypothetical protein